MGPASARSAPLASGETPMPTPIFGEVRVWGQARRQNLRQLAPRGDPELSVRVAEVDLHGLRRHKQGLGDVAVGLPVGGGVATRSGGILADLGDQARVRAGVRAAERGGDERRQALEAPDEVGEEAQRRAVAPVQVVDRDQSGVRAQVDGEPVQAVETANDACRAARRRRLEDRAAGAAAPASKRSRTPASASAARTAGARRRRETRARARRHARRAREACSSAAGASATSRLLPMPASTSTSPPRRPARRRTQARGRARGAPLPVPVVHGPLTSYEHGLMRQACRPSSRR